MSSLLGAFHCTFFCCHCTTRTWKCLISHSVEHIQLKTSNNKFFFLFLNSSAVPKINSWGIFTYIKHFRWNEINATKFWDLRIQVTFSLLLPKWMQKLSNNLKMILLWLILCFTGLGSRYSKGGSSKSKFPNQVLSWGCSWGTHARNNTALVFSASKGSHFEHGHLLSARGICSPCFLCCTS